MPGSARRFLATGDLLPAGGGKLGSLTKWAGWFLVVIALLHSASGIIMSSDQWPRVFAGDLQWDPMITENFEAQLAFWLVPGSFAVPLLIVGFLAIGRGREGRAMPGYVGWLLLANMIVGGWMIFPSGHIWSLIPVTLLLLDVRRSRRSRPAVTRAR